MEERILIVDDDITFALMLRTWLSKRGFGVGTASSVAAARTALEAGGFSLVLSDMRLPDEDPAAMDGGSGCRGAGDRDDELR